MPPIVCVHIQALPGVGVGGGSSIAHMLPPAYLSMTVDIEVEAGNITITQQACTVPTIITDTVIN